MNSKIVHSFIFFMFLIVFGEYNEFARSDDASNVVLKYQDAKKYFSEKKYNYTITILEQIIPLIETTSYVKESLYMLAQSYYEKKNYILAAEYFKRYFTVFPKDDQAELACFCSAYSLYMGTSDTRLDQSNTYKAIQQFQDFLEYYPQSEKREQAQQALLKLEEKLALKSLFTMKLYYRLGDHLSCIVSARNALLSYPFSIYKEDFEYYIFMSKYEIVKQNVKEKKESKYQDVINEYYIYSREYPTGKHFKKIQELYTRLTKTLKPNRYES